MELKVTIEDVKDKKVMIGTPMYGGNCTKNYTAGLVNLARAMGIYGLHFETFFISNESLITRARNYIVDNFLRSDCTHLMFIDADIGFSWRDVFTMLHLCDEEKDQGIVCGPYPKKCIAWEKVAKAAKLGVGDENPFDLQFVSGDFVLNREQTGSFDITDLLEVSEAGTGFMMIDRKVFENFKTKYPELEFKPDHVRDKDFDGSRNIHAYFDTVIDPDTKRYLSEDYMFCQYARKAGSKIWMCPWISLSHDGTYTYQGSLPDTLKLNMSLTSDKTSNKKHYEKGKRK